MKIFTKLLIIFSLSTFAFGQDVEILIKWNKLTDLPEARRNLKVVSVGHQIFALGGYAQPNTGPVKSHFVYDLEEHRWSVNSDMITPRSNFALVSAENRIYAIGGDRLLDKAEYYDVDSDKWSMLPPMPTKRQHIFGDISGENIYIAGGLLCLKCEEEEQLSADLDVYNISNNRWSSLPAMPTSRQNPLVSIVEDSIYVIGGMDNSNNIKPVEVFDVQTQTWKKISDVPEPGFFAGSVVYRNKIFILDGAEENEEQTDIFVYDPAKRKWGKTTPLPYPVKLAGFTISENKLYVVGGCDPDYGAIKTVFSGTIID